MEKFELDNDIAKATLKALSVEIVRFAISHPEGPSEEQRALGLAATTLLDDHIAGRTDLNTWADGAGVGIVWLAISAFDTSGEANRINEEATADPDQFVQRAAKARNAFRAATGGLN